MALDLSRNDPVVQRVLLSWRRLTGSGPGTDPRQAGTLIAVSGGADSTALAIVLARLSPRVPIAIAHILHDMRPPEEALVDRDAARGLANNLQVRFLESSVRVRDLTGNAEANARRERYRALADLAAATTLPFIATAHHAGDQLESVLMALLRGAGPDGLRGIAPRRRIGGGASRVTLIRPMLGIGAAEPRRLCTLAGVSWREDLTNRDTTCLRAALRHNVIPELLRLRPGCDERSVHAAALCGQAADLVSAAAAELLETAERSTRAKSDCLVFDRAALRSLPPIVVGRMLVNARHSLGGPDGADKFRARTLAEAVRVIQDQVTDPRSVHLAGMRVDLTAHEVRVSKGTIDVGTG